MASQSASLIREEAASWVARMDTEIWGDAEEAELQAWLDGDPRRRGALLQAQAAWMTLDKPSVGDSKADRVVATPKFNRRTMFAGGSALIAASLVGALIWIGTPTSYSTAIGEIRRVPLQDGTIVAINTASEVEVRFADTQREVILEKGEAWFQVTKDAARPFVVEAGRVRVRAVGTAFSVHRHASGADILVSEGVVEAWADGAEGNRVRLTAGQRAFVADNAGIRRSPTKPSSIDRKLAWRAGKINLIGEPLSEAVAEFNRYNRRQIVLIDPALAQERFDGILRTDDPKGFAIAVSTALEVPVNLSDPAEIRIGHPTS